MNPEILFLFCSAALLLAVSPGPDNLYVISQSLIHGASAGVWITLGLCSGLIVHTLLVAIGVTALVAATPALFIGLKWLGAGYLCYLAWRFWFTSTVAAAAATHFANRGAWYRRGVVMNLSNPKVGLFFMAFLPQFIQPHALPVSTQFLVLGGLFITIAMMVFIGFSFLAGHLSRHLQKPVVCRWLHRLAGMLFIAMAVRLVVMP